MTPWKPIVDLLSNSAETRWYMIDERQIGSNKIPWILTHVYIHMKLYLSGKFLRVVRWVYKPNNMISKYLTLRLCSFFYPVCLHWNDYLFNYLYVALLRRNSILIDRDISFFYTKFRFLCSIPYSSCSGHWKICNWPITLVQWIVIV